MCLEVIHLPRFYTNGLSYETDRYYADSIVLVCRRDKNLPIAGLNYTHSLPGALRRTSTRIYMEPFIQFGWYQHLFLIHWNVEKNEFYCISGITL